MKQRSTKESNQKIKELKISLDGVPKASVESYNSTRTTFNLSKDIYQNIDWLCTNYEMKQKDFIDKVLVSTATWLSKKTQLHEIISKNLLKSDHQNGDSERRTFVLSKKTLKNLNAVSQETGIGRDQLLSAAVHLQRFMLDELHEKHKKAYEIIEKMADHVNETGQKLTEFLGNEDPILHRISIIGMVIDNLLMAIDSEINKGVPIVPDDFSQQG